ncbi:MAG: VWA domain-containing protein [Myxococcota bacterium]
MRQVSVWVVVALLGCDTANEPVAQAFPEEQPAPLVERPADLGEQEAAADLAQPSTEAATGYPEARLQREAAPSEGSLRGIGEIAAYHQGSASMASQMASRIEAPRRARRRMRPTAMTIRPIGPAGGATVQARPAAPAPAALPQNGVLASNFVGGSGVRARLDDLLDRGVMVNGQMVRLSAFQDRERLPYAVPAQEGMAMYAELERSRLSQDREQVHLQIALLGRQGELPARPRMDVRLLLDRSGSMRGEKWNQAIAAAHGLVDKLRPTDTFALISYSDEANIDYAPARVGNAQRAHAAINSLEVGGGTNIGAALELAERHAPRARASQTVGLVVLVSDGRVTVGQTNPNELGSMARGMFDRAGVLTTSIGLGTDFDEQTMLTIAREGSGSYHFARRAEDMRTILEDELESRVQAVAQGLRVRVELGEGIVAKRVYGSRLLSEREHQAVRATEVAVDQRIARELGIRRTRQREEERGLRIHLPTFRRGDQHVVLMELEVPAGTTTAEIAKITLDYKDLIRRRNGTIVREVSAERTDDRAVAQGSVVRVVKRTVLAFQAGEALQAAANALQAGDSEGARRQLAERRELLEAAGTHWRDTSLRDDAALLARYESVLGSAWNTWDHHTRGTLVMAMNYFGDQRMR